MKFFNKEISKTTQVSGIKNKCQGEPLLGLYFHINLNLFVINVN